PHLRSRPLKGGGRRKSRSLPRPCCHHLPRPLLLLASVAEDMGEASVVEAGVAEAGFAEDAADEDEGGAGDLVLADAGAHVAEGGDDHLLVGPGGAIDDDHRTILAIVRGERLLDIAEVADG